MVIIFTALLFLAGRGDAGEAIKETPRVSYILKKTEKLISAHKINYFSINSQPGKSNAQVKFQISMKFPLLKPDLYILKYNLFPAYLAYTQKSLWNIGQKSMPFEENNYNPELFLDYPVNRQISGRFILRNVVLSPLEHESNGLAGIQSRSWNRQYVMVRLGFEAKEEMDVTNSFLSDKALLYAKLWHLSDYSNQNDYLESIGNNNKFPDYMGQGEIGLSIRNFLWGGFLKDHQLDVKTKLFRGKSRSSCELEFRQQLPGMNFAFYLQYVYGYGETLMRFDQFGRRGFAGLSFSY